jgi:hypothetical protein
MLKNLFAAGRRAFTPQTFRRLRRKLKSTLHPVIDISDQYTELLCGINPGWLERGNLYSFDYALRNLPSGAPIIEIGSFCGLSTNLLAYYKEANGVKNKVINCDKWDWNNTGKVGNSSFTYPEYLGFAKDTYIRNVQMFSRHDLPYTIELFSDDFFEQWRQGHEVPDVFGRTLRLGGPISFCFIDGNHAYEYAKRDFVNTDEFLESGGFILFDDSSDETAWDVSRVRDEVIASRRYDVVARNPNYLFRKK